MIKKVKSEALKVKSVILLAAFFFLLITLLSSPVLSASEASDSAKESSGIQGKIDSLRQAIASKAAVLKLEISKKIQNKTFVGTVESKGSNQLTIKTKNGSRIISVNEYTVFHLTETPQGKNPNQITLADISANDFLVTLGEVDDKNQLYAKKIIKVQKKSESNPDLAWGTIKAVDGNKVTIVNKANEYNLTTTSKTNIQFKNSKGIVGDLREGQIIIFSQDTQNQLIYIYATNNIPTPIPATATNSANLNTSPSANPTIKQ